MSLPGIGGANASARTATPVPSNASSQTSSLLTMPPEIRALIFSHVDDLRSLSAITQTCSDNHGTVYAHMEPRISSRINLKQALERAQATPDRHSRLQQTWQAMVRFRHNMDLPLWQAHAAELDRQQQGDGIAITTALLAPGMLNADDGTRHHLNRVLSAANCESLFAAFRSSQLHELAVGENIPGWKRALVQYCAEGLKQLFRALPADTEPAIRHRLLELMIGVVFYASPTAQRAMLYFVEPLMSRDSDPNSLHRRIFMHQACRVFLPLGTHPLASREIQPFIRLLTKCLEMDVQHAAGFLVSLMGNLNQLLRPIAGQHWDQHPPEVLNFFLTLLMVCHHKSNRAAAASRQDELNSASRSKTENFLSRTRHDTMRRTEASALETCKRAFLQSGFFNQQELDFLCGSLAHPQTDLADLRNMLTAVSMEIPLPQ